MTDIPGHKDDVWTLVRSLNVQEHLCICEGVKCTVQVWNFGKVASIIRYLLLKLPNPLLAVVSYIFSLTGILTTSRQNPPRKLTASLHVISD